MIKYKFLKRQIENIINEAVLAAKDGNEICGLLVDRRNYIEIIQTRNKIKRKGGFSFYYGEVRNITTAAKKLGHEIIGTFHSHTSYIAKPGDNDIAGAVDDSLMLIIDTVDKNFALWRIKSMRVRKIKYLLIDDSETIT